ncbi:hypothetical protein Tco_0363482 [Tanacetum coccineum]
MSHILHPFVDYIRGVSRELGVTRGFSRRLAYNCHDDGRVDIQTKNAGYGGNGDINARRQNKNQAFNAGTGNDESNQIVQRVPRTESTPGKKPRVHDAKYFREQMLLAMKDEAGSNLKDEKNDFMLDNSYGDETLEELTVVVIMIARIQLADENAESEPSYDAKAVSEVYSDDLKRIWCESSKNQSGKCLDSGNGWCVVNQVVLHDALRAVVDMLLVAMLIKDASLGICNVPPNGVFSNEVYGSDSEGFGMNPSSNEFRLCNSDEWRSGNHDGRVIIHGYGGGGDMGIRNVPPNGVFGNEVYGRDSEGFGMNPSSNEFRLCNSDEWRSGNHGGRVIIRGYGGGGDMVVRHGLKGCLDHRIIRSSPILPPLP